MAGARRGSPRLSVIPRGCLLGLLADPLPLRKRPRSGGDPICGSDHGLALGLLGGAAARGFAVSPGASRLAILLSAKSSGRTVPKRCSADRSAPRCESAVQWALATIQFRGTFRVI